MRWSAVFLLIIYFLLLAPAYAETRVALIIGNSAYTVGRLPHPKGDAKAVARLLSMNGFDVTELSDGSRQAMMATLKAFKRKAATADVALVFYAGHGMELEGENWLVPVDATLSTDDDVSGEAVSLKSVRRALERARRLRIVILDACRDNPFLKESASRRSGGRSRGLASVEPSSSEIVAYSAAEEHTASDGDGDHSPYATALLKRLIQPGVDVRKIFGYIYDDVLRATANDPMGPQKPATYYPSMGGDDVPLIAADPKSPADMSHAPPKGTIAFFDSIDATARTDSARLEVSSMRSSFSKGERVEIRISSKAEQLIYCWILAEDKTGYIALPFGEASTTRTTSGTTFYPRDYSRSQFVAAQPSQDMFQCFATSGRLPADLDELWHKSAPTSQADAQLLSPTQVTTILEKMRAVPGVSEARTRILVR